MVVGGVEVRNEKRDGKGGEMVSCEEGGGGVRVTTHQ